MDEKQAAFKRLADFKRQQEVEFHSIKDLQ